MLAPQVATPPHLLNSSSSASNGSSSATNKVSVAADKPSNTTGMTSSSSILHYHDHAKDPVFLTDNQKREAEGLAPLAKKRGATRKFPNQLYKMLQEATSGSEESSAPFEDAVSWLPHGRSFLVHRPAKFTDKIMSRYFSQSKLSSFQRQLSLYGFTRVNVGTDKGSYYHELFLRGRPDLIGGLKRMKVKGAAAVAARNAAAADLTHEEPNFYTMEHCMDSVQVKTKTTSPAMPTEERDTTTSIVGMTHHQTQTSYSSYQDAATVSSGSEDDDEDSSARSRSWSQSSNSGDDDSMHKSPSTASLLPDAMEEDNEIPIVAPPAVAVTLEEELNANITSAEYNEQALFDDFVQDLFAADVEQHFQQPQPMNNDAQLQQLAVLPEIKTTPILATAKPSPLTSPRPPMASEVAMKSHAATTSQKPTGTGNKCQPQPLANPGNLRNAFGRGIPNTCIHSAPTRREYSDDSLSHLGHQVPVIKFIMTHSSAAEDEWNRWRKPLQDTTISSDCKFIHWGNHKWGNLKNDQ